MSLLRLLINHSKAILSSKVSCRLESPCTDNHCTLSLSTCIRRSTSANHQISLLDDDELSKINNNQIDERRSINFSPSTFRGKANFPFLPLVIIYLTKRLKKKQITKCLDDQIIPEIATSLLVEQPLWPRPWFLASRF